MSPGCFLSKLSRVLSILHVFNPLCQLQCGYQMKFLSVASQRSAIFIFLRALLCMYFILNCFKLFLHGILTRWEIMPNEKKTVLLLQVALNVLYTKVPESRRLL